MPQLSCGMKCSRIILIVFNLILLLLGITLWGLGIYVKFHGNFKTIVAVYDITQVLGGNTMGWVGITMIVVGIITSGLALFGCLGAAYEKRCFLYCYAVCLSLVILIEIGVVIVTLQFRSNLWQSYDTGFEKVFQDAYHQNQNATIEVIEELERRFQCCGANSYVDYNDVHYPIPISCYPNQIRVGPPFIKGCAKGVADWIWNELPIIAGVIGGILFIEIFAIVSSLVLGVTISHHSHTDGYEEL